MNVLDLFSGIGGFSLGLERAGMRTVAFCEIEPYCCAVLRKHWPNVPIYGDIRELTANRLAADGISVDVICGGFPCQDISTAGRGAGIEGERSGLWSEYARLIGELRPRYVIVENVAALLGRGLGVVLGDLAEIGYDTEWHCIPASYLGAPHRRDRVWIVGHPNGAPPQGSGVSGGVQEEQPNPNRRGGNGSAENLLAHALVRGRQGPWTFGDASYSEANGEGQATEPLNGGIGEIWRIEPGMGRVANGIPHRSQRLRALGNAVVPQIPEIIGRAIMERK